MVHRDGCAACISLKIWVTEERTSLSCRLESMLDDSLL